MKGERTRKILILSLLGMFLYTDAAFSEQDVARLALSSAMRSEHRSIVVEVDAKDPSDAGKLEQMGWDVVSENAVSPIQMLVSGGQLELLKQNGWSPRVVMEDLDRHFNEKVNADGNLGEYHTYAEMLAAMREAADLYPDIVKLLDIGDSWEKAHNKGGHDIWAVKISARPDTEDPAKPDVLIMGCHHARELITTEIPLALIDSLTSRYATDPTIKDIIDNNEVWIVPMVNPDGHVFVEQGNTNWRKNLNRNGSKLRKRHGVDLNRNYGYKWGHDDYGSSPHRGSEIYRGKTAFSEPETRAIKELTKGRQFLLSLSFHSFGRQFLYPWEYVAADPADVSVFQSLASIYCAQNGYASGNVKSGTIYRVNGGSDDWLYGTRKIFAATVEVGSQFIPPSDKVQKLVAENLDPSLRLISMAKHLRQKLLLSLDVAGVDNSQTSSVYFNDRSIGQLLVNGDIPGYQRNLLALDYVSLFERDVNQITFTAPYSTIDDAYDDIQIRNVKLKVAKEEALLIDRNTYHLGDKTIAEIRDMNKNGDWTDPNPPRFWEELTGASLVVEISAPDAEALSAAPAIGISGAPERAAAASGQAR